MQVVQKPSATVAALGLFGPVSQGAATVATAWIPVGGFVALVASVLLGAMSTNSVVNAKVQESFGADDTARNANASDVETAPSVTLALGELTQAGDPNHSNTVSVIDITTDHLKETTTHIRVSVTVATAASLLAVLVQGVWARYARAGKDGQGAVVTQVVG